MKILFLTLLDIENLNEHGIYHDLLREFIKNGHEVTVITIREKNKNQPTELVKQENVKFLYIKTGNITKTNFLEKGLTTFFLPYVIISKIKKYIKDNEYDLLIYSTPPVTFSKVVDYLKKQKKLKTYLLLKDIWPQSLVDLEVLKRKSLIYSFFKKKEKKLYEQSDHIGCMSQANVDYLLKHNPWIAPEKVEICPNSIEPITIEKNGTMLQKVREKYGIPTDKTIFIYGGNLGKPQGMEHIISCLKACAGHPKAYFVIAGSGTEYPKLKAFLDQTPLSNVRLLYQLPKEDYELLANTCDVGLIFLDHRFTIPNFPSRLLSYMQASMPVLACTDVNTDIGKLIEEGQFGHWCESREPEKFKEKIDQLCAEKEKLPEMGKNARSYLEAHYTVDQAYEIIMKHFEQEGPSHV